ncbi:hypothetical protein CB1_000589011 [Camelus ferus]|nr:hypothetical protein CB1_000589011 [Camelus ferus]
MSQQRGPAARRRCSRGPPGAGATRGQAAPALLRRGSGGHSLNPRPAGRKVHDSSREPGTLSLWNYLGAGGPRNFAPLLGVYVKTRTVRVGLWGGNCSVHGHLDVNSQRG